MQSRNKRLRDEVVSLHTQLEIERLNVEKLNDSYAKQSNKFTEDWNQIYSEYKKLYKEHQKLLKKTKK